MKRRNKERGIQGNGEQGQRESESDRKYELNRDVIKKRKRLRRRDNEVMEGIKKARRQEINEKKKER